MDQITLVLLNLLSLALRSPVACEDGASDRPVLRLHHIDIIVHRLIDTLASSHAAQFRQTYHTNGQPGAASDQEHALALIGAAETFLRSVSIDMLALQQVARAVDDLMVLDAAIRIRDLTDVCLHISHAAFFDYVDHLRFQSHDERGHVIIIGRQEQPDLHVPRFTTPLILREIEIRYTQASPYPEFSSNNLQSRVKGRGLQYGDQWVRADPLADLFLYRRADTRPRLRIEARAVTQALSIATGAIQITLPTSDQLRMTTTAIFTSPDNVAHPALATYIYAW